MYEKPPPLVTLSKVDPVGIWVNGHPVVIPLLDSVLVEGSEAIDLAYEWRTEAVFLDYVRDYDWMVYLPWGVRPNVRVAAESLGWTI